MNKEIINLIKTSSMRNNPIIVWLLPCICVGMLLWACIPKPWRTSTIIPPEVSVLQSGDILLLENDSFRGRIVRLFNKETKFSHVGMIDVAKNDVFLLHADPQLGCISESLRQLFNRNAYRSQLVLRVVEKTGRHKALDFCKNATEQHLPFNQSFRYQKGTGYYCTELIIEAYASADVILLDDIEKDMLVLPERFCHSSALEVVFPKRVQDNSALRFRDADMFRNYSSAVQNFEVLRLTKEGVLNE